MARESNSEEAKEEDKKRADKIKSINAERCSANETTKKADDGYREAIVRENDKLQAATKLSAEVTAQLQEAKKAAAAAAAKAIVAQKQVKGKSLAGMRYLRRRLFRRCKMMLEYLAVGAVISVVRTRTEFGGSL